MTMHTRSKDNGKASAKAPAAQFVLGKRSADALVQNAAQDASESLSNSLQDKDEEHKHEGSESQSKDGNF